MQKKLLVRNLGSSSSGNSTLIWDKKDALLVDIGFSQRYMKEKLEALEIPATALHAALITHLHNDHISQAMLNKMLQQEKYVFLHHTLKPHLLKRFKIKDKKFLRFVDSEPFKIGPFEIKAFEVPHDSVGGCFGYQIQVHQKKITISTDMGFPENGLVNHFVNSDLIILESNHDPQMLNESGRSADLIERIHQIGHLSNQQCSTFLNQILDHSEKTPSALALAHLSEDCNLPELAEKATRTMLDKRDLSEIPVYLFKKNDLSDWIEI